MERRAPGHRAALDRLTPGRQTPNRKVFQRIALSMTSVRSIKVGFPWASALRLVALRRTSLWDYPGSNRAVAGLWLAATAVMAMLGLIVSFPLYYAAEQFVVSAAMVFAAIGTAAILRERGDVMRLAFAFLLIGLAASIVRLVLLQTQAGASGRFVWIEIALIAWTIAAAGRVVGASAGWSTTRAKLAAVLLVAAVVVLTSQWSLIEARVTALLQGEYEERSPPVIDAESLWVAQPELLAKASKSFAAPRPGGSLTFILSLAPGGSQKLFGREAAGVLRVVESRFGSGARSILLSNAEKDLRSLPLANRSNLEGAIAAMHGSYDPGRDLAMIYLTSHGSREGELSTDLPDYTGLKPISAAFLAAALDKAQITRRIVIVSACYSGTWIEPLASPDTIVITASAADRTSFGCDDARTNTVFGQALIDSRLGRGASLREVFADIKRSVAREEAAIGAQPSLPQVYVGARMKGVWGEELGSGMVQPGDRD